MWSKLIRPKWRHRNRDIRAEAVQQLPAADPNLAEVIRHDPDSSIRRQALRRIADRALLLEVSRNDEDPVVSRAASTRLWYLLAQDDDAAAPEQTLKLLQQSDSSDMAEYLVRHSRSAAVRREALAKIESTALLGEIALADDDTAIRLHALERINRLSTLKRIAREARGKNKKVARRARELADSLKRQQELPRLQLQLVESIEQLAAQQHPDQTALHHLGQEWQQTGSDAPAELLQRFARAQQLCVEAHEAWRHSKHQLDHQRQLCEQCESLLQELRSGAAKPSLKLNEIEAAEWMLRNSWQRLEEEHIDINPALRTRFAAALRKLEQSRLEIGRHRVQHARQLAIIADLQTLAARDSSLTAAALNNLESRWKSLAEQPDDALEQQYHHLLRQARERLSANHARAEQLGSQLDQQLLQFEKALEQGQLQASGVARNNAQQTLEKLEQLATATLQQRKALFGRLLGRLNELRDWQRFGSNQVREELISEMQRLAAADLPAKALAGNVRDLREQWRKLDRKGGPASEALWDSFNAAAEKAYAPVVAEQQQRLELQQQAARQRELFCDQLVIAYNHTDWDNPNWQHIDKLVQQARHEWRSLGGVDSATWKKLQQRYIDAIKPFDAQLAKVRKAEQLRRERLIKQVERLAEEADIDSAVTQAKAAQASWKPLVTAGRQIEQRLWSNFKAATDAVFERRSALLKSSEQEQQANATAKRRILEQLQQLIAADTPDWTASRSACEQLRSEWQEIGAAPRQQHKGLQQQFDQLLRDFDAVEATARLAQQRQELELLLRKAELCDRIEQRLCGGDSGVESARAEWASLQPLQTAAETAMQRRYQHVAAARDSGTKGLAARCAESDDNLLRCQQFAVEIELLLDIDSPPEFHQQRREWQLNHLSSAMTGGLADSESARQRAARLLVKSCAIGPLPEQGAAGMHRRWRKIVDALIG
jgi:DNA repair protein SbcC/Rad50